jgi:tRNA(Arg) A34 adenosine deaminase TadA
MSEAIQEAIKNVTQNGGGPFGAVIVKDGEIVATGSNKVTIDCDPTAHGEVMAIRNACKKLGVFDLSGYELYTSCEPCPMCLASCYWANISKIYYSATQTDAANYNFDDAFLYVEVAKPKSERTIPIVEINCKNKCEPFQCWENKADKATYGDNFEGKEQ